MGTLYVYFANAGLGIKAHLVMVEHNGRVSLDSTIRAWSRFELEKTLNAVWPNWIDANKIAERVNYENS